MEILAHHARILPGYPFRKALKQSDTGPVLVVQPKDVGEFKYRKLWTGSLYLFSPAASVERYRIYNGDVLFLARAFKDHAILVQGLPENRPVIASGQFFILRPHRETVRAEYLVWYLNQAPTCSYFLGMGGTSTIPYVRQDILRCTPMDVPALDVQQRIVKIANLWQMEKELVRRHMELRERMIATVCFAAVDGSYGEIENDTTTD